MAPRQRSLSSRPEDSYESAAESVLSEEQQRQYKKLNNNNGSTTPPPPMLNQTEADIARDQHDCFNLVALVRRGGYVDVDLGLPNVVSLSVMPFD
jgi:hypothetical protein